MVRANSSQRGEMVRSTQLLVLRKSVINNGHTLVTWMTSAGWQGEVWILPVSFTRFKRVPPPSHRMRCMWKGSSGMISFHLTGNQENSSGRHRVEKLGQTTQWMLAASVSESGWMHQPAGLERLWTAARYLFMRLVFRIKERKRLKIITIRLIRITQILEYS